MQSGHSCSRIYKCQRAYDLMDLGYFAHYCSRGDAGLKPKHYFRISKGRKNKRTK